MLSPSITKRYLNNQGQICDPDSAFIVLSIAKIESPPERSARRNAQSVAARSLALELLQQHHAYTGHHLSFEKTVTGKPVLEMPYAFDISMAHSGSWAGCAMPTGPLETPMGLGLDIEQFKHRDWQGFAELGVFHSMELDWIMASQHEERNRRALISWCRKEAMLKALGCGLSQPLSEIGFDELGTLLALPQAMGSCTRWVIHVGEILSEEPRLEAAGLATQKAVYAVAWQSN